MKKTSWLQGIISILLVCALFTAAFFHTYSTVVPVSVDAALPYGRNRFTLILDPGHGGEDGGAVSITGTYESKINLAIAKKVELFSAFYGILPVMTRDSDDIEYPESAASTRARKVADQKNRVALINSTSDAVLISIHQNKYTSASPRGCQVFFSPTNGSCELAAYMQNLFLNFTDAGNRQSAVKIPDSIYLMNSISCPAILVECGFISNAKEAELLENGAYQTKLAVIISGGFAGFANQLSDICSEA